jgi:antitoxin component YwqK of YwqJK toxin-antitoxin module
MIEKQSNKPYGFGRTIFSTGERFSDAFYKDGKKNGVSRQLLINGYHYNINWINDIKEGVEKIYNSQGVLKK